MSTELQKIIDDALKHFVDVRFSVVGGDKGFGWKARFFDTEYGQTMAEVHGDGFDQTVIAACKKLYDQLR